MNRVDKRKRIFDSKADASNFLGRKFGVGIGIGIVAAFAVLFLIGVAALAKALWQLLVA